MREAQQLADDLRQPQTSTVVFWMTAVLQLWRGDRAAAARTCEALLEIAQSYGFRHWNDVPLVSLPDPDTAGAIAERHQELMTRPSAIWRRVICLCHLTVRALEVGDAELGGRIIGSVPSEHRQAILAPEIERLEGEVALGLGRQEDAERHFRGAIDMARHRHEKSLELRATTSLARLLAAHGRRQDAHAALAAIHGWFTEGFESLDLREAGALLRELVPAPR